jgi:Fic family protein
MSSFSEAYLAKLVVRQRIITMIRKLGEHKGRQELYKKQSPEMLENLRQVALIQSTESSNRLEGVIAEDKRLRALVEEKVKPINRSEAEIAGYRDVLNTIHQSHEHMPFTERVVLQLHRDLMKYAGEDGGTWKATQNEITEELSDGTRRVRFIPIAPHLTAEAMRTLHARYIELEKAGGLDPLLLIPLYVVDFLCIHPFRDGNGRMARLIALLLLYQHGYEVGRYVSLERIIEQTKESYYETLYSSSQGWHGGQHDVLPWTEYFLSTLLAAYAEFEGRFGRISKGRGSKTDMIRNAVNGFIADFTITEVERACPKVSRDMIRHVLGQLREEAVIVPIGKGRGAKWRKVEPK